MGIIFRSILGSETNNIQIDQSKGHEAEPNKNYRGVKKQKFLTKPKFNFAKFYKWNQISAGRTLKHFFARKS